MRLVVFDKNICFPPVRVFVCMFSLTLFFCLVLTGQVRADKVDQLTGITKENVNDYDEKGLTPLINEVMGGPGIPKGSPENIRRIKHLLALGADPDMPEKGPRQIRPLETAVRFKAGNSVKALVEGGASIYDYTGNGNSLLSIAIGDEDIFTYLLQKGANPDVKFHSKRDFSLLCELVRQGKNKLAISMLEAGANPNWTSKRSEPCICTAAFKNNEAMVTALLKYGAEINGNFILGPLSGGKPNLEMVKLLVENGANINEKNERGTTPLHLASIYSNVELVKFYLEKGADPSIRDNEGKTYLEVKKLR